MSAESLLDLAPLGFHPLFDAVWIQRDPAAPPPRTAGRGTQWRRVADEQHLEHWESAWRDHDSPAVARAFLPGLVADGAGLLLVAALTIRSIAVGSTRRRSSS